MSEETLTEDWSPWAIHLRSHTLQCALPVNSHRDIHLHWHFSCPHPAPTFLLSLRAFGAGLRWRERTVTLWAVWRPVNFLTRCWEVLVTCSYLHLSHLLAPLVQVKDWGHSWSQFADTLKLYVWIFKLLFISVRVGWKPFWRLCRCHTSSVSWLALRVAEWMRFL